MIEGRGGEDCYGIRLLYGFYLNFEDFGGFLYFIVFEVLWEYLYIGGC